MTGGGGGQKEEEEQDRDEDKDIKEEEDEEEMLSFCERWKRGFVTSQCCSLCAVLLPHNKKCPHHFKMLCSWE